jgi:hypothetical protein
MIVDQHVDAFPTHPPPLQQGVAGGAHYSDRRTLRFQPGDEVLVPAVSVQLVRVHEGHTVRLLCPVSRRCGKLVAIQGNEMTVLGVEARPFKVSAQEHMAYLVLTRTATPGR